MHSVRKSIKDIFYDKFWIWIIVGFIISVVTAFIITALIEYGREHGHGVISAIFTPGRQSAENIRNS